MKKFLSGIVLILSIFSFWSCEKKEQENVLEKELTGSWNYECEHRILDNGQPIEPPDIYNGTIIFHNDHTFEYKLDPASFWDTKGTWKVVDNQVYMYFYKNLHEYDGVYDVTPFEGGIELYLVDRRSNFASISVKLKLTK